MINYVAPTEFKLGEAVTWLRQSPGGYGFIQHVPAVVVGHTEYRVIISAKLSNGDAKVVRVKAVNLKKTETASA